MPELIAPTASLHAAWLVAHREWGPGVHEDGFGLRADDEVESAAGFAEWVRRLAAESGGCAHRWIVADGEVLGGIALRYGTSDAVLRAGHIGYGVRPSARRRGVASRALAGMLEIARERGMGQVLLLCADGNVASARTIEKAGGVLESVRDTELGPARRYWIALG
ncbi:GNAT family N-acetyltransferase [Nocardia asteroides]|uniref:GNAT family N-acetyltransferase n=1 Tax=Nocardia asteroides TaxID=1824 RepID=UPI001E63F1A0|nr:GNAT family N-acetyltransferase [Nocardia asteroides]UGT60475.1 GNAT family N-acetyltransferase [Nocardia asteroides]